VYGCAGDHWQRNMQVDDIAGDVRFSLSAAPDVWDRQHCTELKQQIRTSTYNTSTITNPH